MNELIQELAAQADIVWKESGDLTQGHTITDIENFAKLIVQECIDIAYEYDAPKMSGPGMIIAGQIQDHFGLDE